MSKGRKKKLPSPPFDYSLHRMPRSVPPDDLPVYRLLTGKDDAIFCRRVSEALQQGYRLYGSPSITFNGTEVIAAQAVRWPEVDSSWPPEDDDIPF